MSGHSEPIPAGTRGQRIDKEAIRANLTVPDLLAVYGYSLSYPSEKGTRYNDCPSCGSGNSRKFSVTDDAGHCHSCGFTGDLFAVATAILGLSCSDFPRVIETCASIAGISGDYDSAAIERSIRRRAAEREEAAAKAAKEREAAEAGARELWYKLATRNGKGQAYVAHRAVLPQRAGSECRYTSRSVCLPLWRDNVIVNVVGRRFDGGLPKIRGLDRCGTRGTFGKPAIKPSHVGPIIITEGFFDYLSARQMSPTRLVLGAHGCSNLPYVAAVGAELAKGTGAGLVLIPHHDDAGASAMKLARQAAIAVGLSASAITVFNVGEGCNDLNDHLCKQGKATP